MSTNKLTNQSIKKLYHQHAECAAVIWTILCGMFIHLFRLVTPIHNYDDIGSLPSGFGTGTSSGRWFLNILGNWLTRNFGDYNLPLIKGFIFIVLIALSAGFLVSIFKITNRTHAILIGLAFISFPTATSTLLFMFTAPYYGFGVLLAVIAAWILPKYNLLGFLLSAVCTALSLGIYQAFLPITTAILVLQLIKEALQEDREPYKIIVQGFYDCFALATGVILYFICNSAALKYYNVSLNSYRGISEMGKLSLTELPGLIWKAFSSACLLPFHDFARIAQTDFLKIGYLLVFIASFAVFTYSITKKKNLFTVLLTSALFLIFPIAVNLIVIMSPDAWIYSLMVYSFALVICMPLILWETLPAESGRSSFIKPLAGRLTSILAVFLIICNTYMANANYNFLYYTNRQVENYLTSLVTQVRMTEGFDPEKKWVFEGNIEDPMLQGSWNNFPYYGGNVTTEDLLNAYSRRHFINAYLGYSIPFASAEEIAQIKSTAEYQQMPSWPTYGSIKVLDDYVIVKLEE